MSWSWRPPFIWWADLHPDNGPYFYQDTVFRLSFPRTLAFLAALTYTGVTISAFGLKKYLNASFSLSAATNHWFACLFPAQVAIALVINRIANQQIKSSGSFQALTARDMIMAPVLFPEIKRALKEKEEGDTAKGANTEKSQKKGPSLQVNDLFVANRATFGTSQLDFSRASLTREEFEEVFRDLKPELQ